MRQIFRKWWIILPLAVVIAIALELIQVWTQPETNHYSPVPETQESDVALFPDYLTGVARYDYTESGLTVTGGDPQFYLYTEEAGEFSYLSFFYSRPTPSEQHIQVFYLAHEAYCEEDSVKSTAPSGVEYWSVQIPAGSYPELRIDIDSDYIPLQTISAGNTAPQVVPDGKQIQIRRILIVSAFLLTFFAWMIWMHAGARLKKTVRGAAETLKADKKGSALKAGVFLAVVGGTVLLFWLLFILLPGVQITGPKLVFAVFAGIFLACMMTFRKTLGEQPEYLFLVLVICLGFLLSYYVPHSGLNSLDEDVHYYEALDASYINDIHMTRQDERTIARTPEPNWDLSGGVQAVHDQQDELYHADCARVQGSFSSATFPEFFNGIGLFLGRALGLRYYMIHFMGRFIGLLTYALAGFFAIRKLKSGKMIAAAVLLIPTSVFLASSYNYDCYLTGFTALGLCYYFALWQDREAKVTLKDAVIMIVSTSFGCMTKPVYLPLLWILILIPRAKFADRRHHTRFVWALIGASFFLVFIYALPILKNTGAMNDMRGGAEVSAVGQMRYILSNPLKYINTMWRYMVDEYFNLGRVGEILTYYAYHGVQPNQYLYLILLLAAAFTDKNEHDRELVGRPWAHIWPVLVSLALIVLVMTSMYLAFTPVGAERVAGAQFRYLIPMILPTLMVCGSGLVQNRMNRRWYNGLVIGAAALINFACVYNGIISKYFLGS